MDDPGLTGLCKDCFTDTKAEVGREARRGAVGSSSRVSVWTCGCTTGTWMNVRVVVGTSCTWLCVEPSEARVCSRPCVHVHASLHVDLYVKVCVGACVRAGHERASAFVSVEDVCGYA